MGGHVPTIFKPNHYWVFVHSTGKIHVAEWHQRPGHWVDTQQGDILLPHEVTVMDARWGGEKPDALDA
jgi:hypothetical protein